MAIFLQRLLWQIHIHTLSATTYRGIIFVSDTILMRWWKGAWSGLTLITWHQWFSSLAPWEGHAKTESSVFARHQRCICVPKVRDSQRSHPSAVLIRVCPRQETRGWWLVKHSGHYHHMTTFLHSVPILSPAPPVTLLLTDWSDHTTEECWIGLANEPSRRFQITGKAPTRRAFSWLKLPTSNITLKSLLRC